jgi:hypothetical protein
VEITHGRVSWIPVPRPAGSAAAAARTPTRAGPAKDAPIRPLRFSMGVLQDIVLRILERGGRKWIRVSAFAARLSEA